MSIAYNNRRMNADWQNDAKLMHSSLLHRHVVTSNGIYIQGRVFLYGATRTQITIAVWVAIAWKLHMCKRVKNNRHDRKQQFRKEWQVWRRIERVRVYFAIGCLSKVSDTSIPVILKIKITRYYRMVNVTKIYLNIFNITLSFLIVPLTRFDWFRLRNTAYR